MLLVALTKNEDSLLVIRHLPARERKNWARTSGPILRLDPKTSATTFSALVENHFDEFGRGLEPRPSEFDNLPLDEKQKLFASHRFVGIELRAGNLVISPSEVLDASQLSIRFAPPERVQSIDRPWNAEVLWRALMAGMADSKNQSFDSVGLA